MAKLGSKEKPAIVRVQTDKRAHEILSLCSKNDWQVIIGLEPSEEEDTRDIERLLNPPMPVKSMKIDRNSSCVCGSGKKYKNCCLNLK
jgi:SWIM/SEC-C metal-binding protein